MAVLLLLLLQTLTLTLASSMTTDGLSLLALRSAVSLDPTRALSSWSPSDSGPCLWPGVSCRPDGRVSALFLRDLRLSGYLPSVLPLLSALRSLDLSRNNFSGRVPDGLAGLASLSHLDLSENRLSGPLPPSVAALPSLAGVLNLSCNLFSGDIPPEFGNIPVAVSLDLRNNNLSGQIPQVESLLNQGPTAFSGNPGLCGFPLKNPCSPTPTDPNPDSDPGLPLAGVESPVRPAEPKERAAGEKPRASPAVTVSVLGAVILAAFVSILVLHWQFRKRRGGGEEGKRRSRKEKGRRGGGEVIIAAAEERREGRSGEIYVAVDEGFELELEDLLRASAYVVGKSKSGIVYKVVVGRGPAVAVRRLSEAEEGEVEGDEWRRRRAFESEAMAIGRVNHPNVLRLRAYYYAPDEKLLIYDYIPNGTLYSAIHGGPLNPAAQPLPWASRLGIVEGAARGLAHLHECTPRKYIHGNIKTSKILLDDELHPYISGFGLNRLPSGTQKFNHSLSLSRKLGSAASTTKQYMSGPSTEYLAPEARASGSSVTQKSDVYAFGVVLLEVLTGRSPGVKSDNDQAELEGFVRRAFKEERPLSEVVDPALLHEVYAKNQVLAVFHIALGCTESDPESRPRMRAVSESLDRVGSQH